MSGYACALCPRRCGAWRAETGSGFCGMGALPRVARIALHFDEEPCISGERGSGAVFFSGCALQCVYCQNDDISRGGFGREIGVDALRRGFQRLITQGAHNINLVSPTHFVRPILEALEPRPAVPVIWNTGGYECVETLRMLEGHVQVYLPDLKYVDAEGAARYSCAADYFDFASRALIEMHRQVGNPVLNEDGIIQHGLIVRHLILPGRVHESMRALDWIATNLPGAWVSLMAQYTPCGRASQYPELSRPLSQDEYDRVVDHLFDLGLEDGYVQELESADRKYIPPFDLTGVED